MPHQQTVLLVGGTGRTGQRALRQLLERGARVRVIVRSAAKLPSDLGRDPNLTVVTADLLSIPDAELRRHLDGCDAVVSCLGHVISLKGIFGPPRDLVTRATTRLCRGIEALEPKVPVKFILMSSVSVHGPRGRDRVRGRLERLLLCLLRAVVPPARDNQRAADFLREKVAPDNAFVQWVAVRPDTLLEGPVSNYELHEDLVNSLFAPGSTSMANVAHFMGELVTNPKTWADWKSKLPVIVNVASKTARAA